MLLAAARRKIRKSLTNSIEHEADESVVGCKWQENFVDQDNVLEVVNNTFSIEKVHCRCQPIPVERLCKSQPPRATRDVCNGDNFLEGDDLYCRDQRNDVYVPHKHSTKEGAYHDQRPYGSRDEGCLFLFVL